MVELYQMISRTSAHGIFWGILVEVFTDSVIDMCMPILLVARMIDVEPYFCWNMC